MSISPGTRFGSYEIVEPIGSGGMGEVYRARDTTLGRDVAIKVLPASFSNDAMRVARFEQEAKTLAALNQANIAHVYGLERAEGSSIGIVMELVDGRVANGLAARGAPNARALPREGRAQTHRRHARREARARRDVLDRRAGDVYFAAKASRRGWSGGLACRRRGVVAEAGAALGASGRCADIASVPLRDHTARHGTAREPA